MDYEPKGVKITIDAVRLGIVRALQEHFPSIPIRDEIPQGSSEPCFLVTLNQGAQHRGLGRRRRRQHLFQIEYVHGDRAALHLAIEGLFVSVDSILVNGTVFHGVGMRYEIAGDRLAFFVQFDFHVLLQGSPSQEMQEMQQDGGLK